MNRLLAGLVLGYALVFAVVIGVPRPAPAPVAPVPPPVPVRPAPRFPARPAITNPMPGYQDYGTIQRQLEEWKAQAPGLVETGSYGTSTRGAPLVYVRLTNLLDPAPRPKVLIQACIHGNEPIATSTTMAFVGAMLSTYGADPEATELLNTRDVYVVPVVSPDSYPSSRQVDGVDPNRDYPGPHKPSHRSVAPVRAVGEFFTRHQFKAAISGHSFGRVFLYAHGDTSTPSANDADYQRILGKMCQLSGYRKQRGCEMYSRPIRGTDIDFYYRGGALSIVTEYGTHQHRPSLADTKTEFDKTYRATLHFVREAPLVPVRPALNSDFELSGTLLWRGFVK